MARSPSARPSVRSIRRFHRGDAGFTLIELLLVIVILGVLAAVVTFSVGGIAQTGDEAACKSDKSTLTVAEEAARARHDVGAYVEEPDLAALGFLTDVSSLHEITFTDPGTPLVVGSITVTAHTSSPTYVAAVGSKC